MRKMPGVVYLKPVNHFTPPLAPLAEDSFTAEFIIDLISKYVKRPQEPLILFILTTDFFYRSKLIWQTSARLGVYCDGGGILTKQRASIQYIDKYIDI